jgi:hypothetical protein
VLPQRSRRTNARVTAMVAVAPAWVRGPVGCRPLLDTSGRASVSTSDVVRPSLFVSLLGVLLVAVVAARLLGVRRSVPANLVSGVLGWVAGVALSTVIAHSQPNPNAGFTRNVWVFSTVFTMSAIVWAELLARPGTLARAQSGLIRPARP